MENPDEVVPDKFVGCTIDWAAGKDTTGERRVVQCRDDCCFGLDGDFTVMMSPTVHLLLLLLLVCLHA